MRSKSKSRHDSRQFGLSYFSILNPRNDDFEKIELEFHEFSQPTKSADEINNVLDEIASDLETKCVMENVVGDSVVVVIEDQKWKKFKREECLPKKSRNSEDISFALKKLVKLGFLARQKRIRALKVSLMYSKSMEVKVWSRQPVYGRQAQRQVFQLKIETGFLRDEFQTGKQNRVLRRETGSETGFQMGQENPVLFKNLPQDCLLLLNPVLLACLKFVSQETCLDFELENLSPACFWRQVAESS